MALEVPGVSFTTPAMLPPVTAGVLPSVPGLPMSCEPAQLHPVTYQLGQATVWQGLPGPLGNAGQLVQLPCVVPLPPMAQLPCGVQLPAMAAPCPPAHGWGQQVVMGTLVPNQPMGLEPWAMVDREPRHPAAQHGVQGLPVVHTLPGITEKPLQPSDNGVGVMEDSVPDASPHHPTAALPCGRTQAEPKGVSTPEALEKPLDVPELVTDTFAEAFPELAGDTLQSQDEESFGIDFTDMLALLDPIDGKDTIPDVPGVPNSPCLTPLLNELLDFSEYVAKGGCPKEQAAVVGLRDSVDTVPDVPSIPYLTTSLNKLLDLLEYRAEGVCTKEQAVATMPGDSEDTIPDGPKSSTLTTFLNIMEPEAVVGLGDGEDTFLDVLGISDSLTSTAFLNQLLDFSEYGAEGDCPEDRAAAVMLGDVDPFMGVVTSPLQDEKEKQGMVAAVLPTWLPVSPMETAVESALKGHPEGPPESALKGLLESPRLSPEAPLQPHPPCMAPLVEEALRRQPQVVVTRLPLPPGLVSCQVLPRSAKAGSKQAKRPAPASTHKRHETSPWDNMPPKKKKKGVVCQVAKNLKTLKEGTPDGDGAAAGSSRQQAGSSKRRASDNDNVPTKRARTLGDAAGQSALRTPECCQ
ncbi:proline-rich protein 36-like [Grus japonensis]|uniref:Proline-rich protein 36-like n=1 Tax=Grus japonensis TaxID=30415 RepID=A0ABC9Y8K8_GRUJA